MAKRDRDLFDRLRQVGVRKQVAKTLAEIGDDASAKAVRAARVAANDLRALADEIERRLPGAVTKTTTATAPARARRARTPVRAAPANGARTPRGANKAKILQALRAGTMTASEVAAKTGIG